MSLQRSLPKIHHTPATYQDVLNAPPNTVAEIIKGKLHVNPRPTFEHGSATLALLANLVNAYQFGFSGPGGWLFIHEPEIHLRGHVLVPDGAAWHTKSLPATKIGPHVSITPNWIVETLSPSTKETDLTTKRDIYAECGIQSLWFLDPEELTLEALSLHSGAYVSLNRLSGDAPVLLEPFELAKFLLSDLWSWKTPQSSH